MQICFEKKLKPQTEETSESLFLIFVCSLACNILAKGELEYVVKYWQLVEIPHFAYIYTFTHTHTHTHTLKRAHTHKYTHAQHTHTHTHVQHTHTHFSDCPKRVEKWYCWQLDEISKICKRWCQEIKMKNGKNIRNEKLNFKMNEKSQNL